VHSMVIISRVCFPKWRHWCPGVAWVSQRTPMTPLGKTQPTNNDHTMHALLFKRDLVPPLLHSTHTVTNDCRYVVPPTLYPTWWWPVRKRPKHVVGTLLYIQT